jgi:DNA-binding FadR family transcriptional regulator
VNAWPTADLRIPRATFASQVSERLRVLTESDVRDIYLAREALESAAVEHIVESGRTDEVADELDRCVDQMQDAPDPDAFRAHRLEFHAALVAASGSERLQRMYRSVNAEAVLCAGKPTSASTNGIDQGLPPDRRARPRQQDHRSTHPSEQAAERRAGNDRTLGC